MIVLTYVSSAASRGETATASAQEPGAMLRAAEELYRDGYYDRAIAAYASLVGGKETAVGAAVGGARAMLQVGRYQEALAYLDGVKDPGQGSADWHWVRACVLGELGRYAEGIEDCRKALERKPDHCRARYLLGRLHEIAGRSDDTIKVYNWFNTLFQRTLPTDPEDLTCAGQGFYRYSQLVRHENLSSRTKYVLQEVYQLAYERVDRTCWSARLAAAELLLAKHNLEQAGEDFSAALKITKNLPRALVGLGSIALERWDFQRVENLVRDALAINPNYVPAMTLLAANRMTERRYAEAAAECDKALAVNPNDVEALSMKAAALIRQLKEDQAQACIERVRQINPRCGLLEFTLGRWQSAARQFPEAEAHFSEAIEFEPYEADYRTELGLMYMQWGREEQARATLDAAWKLDEFNRQTYNTLELLDTLESFQTHETEHFTIKYQGERDAVLAPYFAEYLEGIYADLVEDFGARPDEKTIVEVFPRHDQFAVRITGKPWIHTIGASTGRVIALDAPRPDAHTTGPFHWARVLRHEFTHTVTLAATRNRIPHWFTEGLAVMQEETPRNWEFVRLLTEAIRGNRLFTLDSIDWGFVRPKESTDRVLAYAQSQWMCEYIVEKHGYATITKMIERFRDGKTQEQVFQELMQVSPSEFSTAFREWARVQAGTWGMDVSPYESGTVLQAALLLKPKDASLHAKLAERQAADREFDKAVRSARKALELDPDEQRAIAVLIELLMAKADGLTKSVEVGEIHDEAWTFGEHLARLNPDSAIAARHLARIALRRGKTEAALQWYQRLKRLCPMDPAGFRGLATIYLEQKQRDKALPELIELARMDDGDAALRRKIAGILESKGDDAGAVRWFTEAIHVDPYDPETHKDLAELYVKMNAQKQAIREYEILCRLSPEVADYRARLAFAYDRAGEKVKARSAAQEAVRLDANSPAKALLQP